MIICQLIVHSIVTVQNKKVKRHSNVEMDDVFLFIYVPNHIPMTRSLNITLWCDDASRTSAQLYNAKGAGHCIGAHSSI